MENLPNNQVAAPQPLVFAGFGGDEEQQNFDFWGVISRRKWLIFLGLLTGVILGALYNAQADVIYESRANIRIEPKDPVALRLARSELMLPDSEKFNIRHDRSIAQYTSIERCLDKNNLFVLDSFVDLSKEEVVELVLEDLAIVPDREDPLIYQLTYHSTSPNDSATILNNVIKSYNEQLELQYENETDEYVNVLKNTQLVFESKYEEVNQQISELRSQVQVPVIQGKSTIHELAIGKLFPQIEEYQATLKQLILEKERVDSAIASGETAIEEMVWNLEQEKKINSSGGNNAVANEQYRASFQIEQRIAQANIELQVALQRFGPTHPQVQSRRAQAQMLSLIHI